MVIDSKTFERLLSIIPPLSSDAHKGQAGRIGIVGGSKNYTGAPYFAAISALRVGCDLAHVFCVKEASPVIKSYDPELIVHPILDSPNFVEEISVTLPQLHSLVIGPGLGRDEEIFRSLRQLIKMAKERDLPIVFDADSLFYLKDSPNDIISYRKAILTPNEMEFNRLYKAVAKEDLQKMEEQHVSKLASLLGNVTIAKKGRFDIISDGMNTVVCDEPGSNRRCGGQGDLLSGSLGVFNYWAHQFTKSDNHSAVSATIIASLGACMLTRRCNYMAFQKFQRSMLTSDMIKEINNAFTLLFEKTP